MPDLEQRQAEERDKVALKALDVVADMAYKALKAAVNEEDEEKARVIAAGAYECYTLMGNMLEFSLDSEEAHENVSDEDGGDDGFAYHKLQYVLGIRASNDLSIERTWTPKPCPSFKDAKKIFSNPDRTYKEVCALVDSICDSMRYDFILELLDYLIDDPSK